MLSGMLLQVSPGQRLCKAAEQGPLLAQCGTPLMAISAHVLALSGAGRGFVPNASQSDGSPCPNSLSALFVSRCYFLGNCLYLLSHLNLENPACNTCKSMPVWSVDGFWELIWCESDSEPHILKVGPWAFAVTTRNLLWEARQAGAPPGHSTPSDPISFFQRQRLPQPLADPL